MKKILLLVLSLITLQAQAAFLPIGPGPVSNEKISALENHFPEVLGTNLEGKETMLPQELKGTKNLVVIAFKRLQQDEINTWMSATESFYDEYSGFEFYELPVIKAMNFFMRFNINNGMRFGIDDEKQRQRTITLYINKESFKEALGIPSEDFIHVLLLDEEGEIQWRTRGPASPDKIKSLELELNGN